MINDSNMQDMNERYAGVIANPNSTPKERDQAFIWPGSPSRPERPQLYQYAYAIPKRLYPFLPVSPTALRAGCRTDPLC